MFDKFRNRCKDASKKAKELSAHNDLAAGIQNLKDKENLQMAKKKQAGAEKSVENAKRLIEAGATSARTERAMAGAIDGGHLRRASPHDEKEMHYFDARANEIYEATSPEDYEKFFGDASVQMDGNVTASVIDDVSGDEVWQDEVLSPAVGSVNFKDWEVMIAQAIPHAKDIAEATLLMELLNDIVSAKWQAGMGEDEGIALW